MAVTLNDLRNAVSLLAKASGLSLSLDGAYDGWRVEIDGCRDFLGTGYRSKREMYTTIWAVLNFHQATKAQSK